MKQLFHLGMRHFFVFTLCWLLSYFLPQSVHAMTLTDAASEALHANPKLLAAAQELEETRQRIRQAFAGYLPSIDFSMGQGREWLNSPTTRAVNQGGLTMSRGEAGMNLTQPIFDGFNTVYKVEQAEAQVRAADFAYQEVAESLTFDVAEAYLEVQKQRKLLKLATDAMTLHSDILIKTRKMAQLGITADMDVRQAESRVALIAADLSVTEGALRSADTRFISLVGFPPGLLSQPTFDQTTLPTSKNQALEKAMLHEASLQKAGADLDAIRAESKANAASLLPKISLDMAVSDTNNAGGVKSYTQDASAILRFKYNFYRGGADLSKFKETSHKAARFREKLEQTRNLVEDKVNRAWNALLSSRARQQSLDKHVKTLEAVNRDHQEQYRLGTQSLLDLLNSENELLAARRMLSEEGFRFMTESYRLLSSMGVLKASLLQSESAPSQQGINQNMASKTVSSFPTASLANPADPPNGSSPIDAQANPADPPNGSFPIDAQANPADPPNESSPIDAQANPADSPNGSSPIDAQAKPNASPLETAPPPMAAPKAKPVKINPPTSEPPLSKAQEEAMILLVDSLFNETDSQATPLQQEASPAPITQEADTNAIPASEALTALAATLTTTAQSAASHVSRALTTLSETVNHSIEQTPKPTQTVGTEEGKPCKDEAANWPDPLWETNETDPLAMDPIALMDYMHIITNDATSPDAELPPPDLLQYTLQVGAFQNESSAINLIGQLQHKGLELYLNETLDSRKQRWYLVWIGRYDTESAARKALKAFLQQESRPAFITPVARRGHSTIEPPTPEPQGDPIGGLNTPQPASEPKGDPLGGLNAPKPTEYAVQVGGFDDPNETEKRLVTLISKGYNLYLNETRTPLGKPWQVIWIGRFTDKSQAQAAAEAFFQKEGEAAVVIEIQPDSPTNPQFITQIGNPA